MQQFLVCVLSNIESEKQHSRHILPFYYRKDKNAVQASNKFSDVCAEDVWTVHQCQNSFDLAILMLNVDAPRSGKPVEANENTTKAFIDIKKGKYQFVRPELPYGC